MHMSNRSWHTAHLILLGIVFLLQWFLTMFAVFLLYFSALHTSLACFQGFSLIVTMHNSTALKVRVMQKTYLFVILFRSPDTKKKKWANYDQSWMVGVGKAYMTSRRRSIISPKWYWKRSTYPSSSNLLNACIPFTLSNSPIINLWWGYCAVNHRLFVLINCRCILPI